MFHTLPSTWVSAPEWEGFPVWLNHIAGRPVKLVSPKPSAVPGPWAWRTEFFGSFANTDVELLKRGIWIAYMDVQDHYGSPKAMEYFDAFYHELTEACHFPKQAAMIGLSRGGLFALNWAIDFPSRVACIYADNPVLDFKSWPGGRGAGPGSPADWKKLLAIYGFESEEEALTYEFCPIDQVEVIAKAGIPCLFVAGDADEVVPFEENTELFLHRLEAHGGFGELILQPGGKHHPHGLPDPKPIADFIERYIR